MKITDLTREQRFDMQSIGLNPLNPSHIEKFLSGVTFSAKDIQTENIQRLGDLINRRNLGSGSEREINISDIESGKITAETNLNSISKEPVDYRKEIEKSLENYTSSPISRKSIGKKSNKMFIHEHQMADDNSKVTQMAIEYFKCFALSLKEQSLTSYTKTYTSLKSILTLLLEIKKQNPSSFNDEFGNLQKITSDFYKEIKA